VTGDVRDIVHHCAIRSSFDINKDVVMSKFKSKSLSTGLSQNKTVAKDKSKPISLHYFNFEQHSTTLIWPIDP